MNRDQLKRGIFNMLGTASDVSYSPTHFFKTQQPGALDKIKEILLSVERESNGQIAVIYGEWE